MTLPALGQVTVVKSDGSGLYIIRDVAAALHRKQLFQVGSVVNVIGLFWTSTFFVQFDRMLYVVEAGQQLHFQRLKGILEVLNQRDVADKIEHVRFGKIRGLSTRKGMSYFCATNQINPHQKMCPLPMT